MTDQEKRDTLKQATQDFVKGIINDTTNDIINVFEETKTEVSNPTPKITPTLFVSNNTTNAFFINMRNVTSMNIQVITYNGDGNLYLFDFTGNVQATIQTRTSDTILDIGDGGGTFKVSATEGTNYAAATPVTVTVIGLDSIAFTDNGNITLNVLTEDTEVTEVIKQTCFNGIDNEGNMLAYWSEEAQAELEGIVKTGYDSTFDVDTVQLAGDIPDEPVTIVAYLENLYFCIEEGQKYYVIFTTAEDVSDHKVIEALGQSDCSITFELSVEFIETYLDTPTTMIVLAGVTP